MINNENKFAEAPIMITTKRVYPSIHLLNSSTSFSSLWFIFDPNNPSRAEGDDTPSRPEVGTTDSKRAMFLRGISLEQQADFYYKQKL